MSPFSSLQNETRCERAKGFISDLMDTNVEDVERIEFHEFWRFLCEKEFPLSFYEIVISSSLEVRQESCQLDGLMTRPSFL